MTSRMVKFADMTLILKSSLVYAKMHCQYQFEKHSYKPSSVSVNVIGWATGVDRRIDRQHYDDNTLLAKYGQEVKLIWMVKSSP